MLKNKSSSQSSNSESSSLKNHKPINQLLNFPFPLNDDERLLQMRMVGSQGISENSQSSIIYEGRGIINKFDKKSICDNSANESVLSSIDDCQLIKRGINAKLPGKLFKEDRIMKKGSRLFGSDKHKRLKKKVPKAKSFITFANRRQIKEFKYYEDDSKIFDHVEEFSEKLPITIVDEDCDTDSNEIELAVKDITLGMVEVLQSCGANIKFNDIIIASETKLDHLDQDVNAENEYSFECSDAN